jgi:exosortase
LARVWGQLPNKAFFFGLLGPWLALFHFYGNATLGYVRTPSIFKWMLNAYNPPNAAASGGDDAMGQLIPFVVLALFWWKRKELLAQPLRLWTPGLLIVAVALLVHLMGYAVQQPRLSVIALFAGIYGLMGVTWGPGWLRSSFFPFFLFAFCVPLGLLMLPMTFPLRVLVCRLVEMTSNTLLGVGIVREGTKLTNVAGQYQYEVAAACSGIRSLIATIGLATVFGFVWFKPWWKRGVMIAAAIPLAVLGNYCRMMFIIVASEMFGARAGQYVHEGGPLGILSLLPYVPAFAGLLLLAHWMRGSRPGPILPLEPKTA